MTQEASYTSEQHSKSRILKGSVWAFSGRWGMKFLGLISTLFVVRLLLPQDFGIIMKLMLAVSPIGTCIMTGFAETLLVTKKPTQEHYNTAFTMNVIWSILGFIALCLLSPLMVIIFKEPLLKIIVPLYSLKFLFVGLINPRRLDFQKNFEYLNDFKYNIYTKIIQIICIVSGCFYFRNYYGLIVGQIFAMLGTIFVSYMLVYYRPSFSLKYIKEFIDFSYPNLRAGLGEYILMNLDRLLLVRFLNNIVLGFYNLAYELAEQFTTEIIYPLARGFFPVFSDIADDKTQLKNIYLTSMSFLIPLCLAIGFGLSMTAKALIEVYAGDKWLPTVDFFQILALSGASQAFCLVSATVLGATGKIKTRARLTLSHTFMTALFMIPFAIQGNIMAVLYVKLTISLLFVFLNLLLICRYLKISISEIISYFMRPVIATLTMIIVLYFIDITNPYINLLTHIFAGFLSFTGTHFILWAISGKPDTIEKVISNNLYFNKK